MSASFHDSIFAVGAFILFLALFPCVIRKTVLPMSTILTTGGVLFVFTLNYASMHYWYATVVEALNVICWVILYRIARKAQHGNVA